MTQERMINLQKIDDLHYSKFAEIKIFAKLLDEALTDSVKEKFHFEIDSNDLTKIGSMLLAAVY